MKQYVTTATINFPAGTVLKLDEEQARSRAHLLTKTDMKGAYLAMDQVQFKKGEEIGLDGELDKRLRQMVNTKGLSDRTRKQGNSDNAPVKQVFAM